jgi:hypothetical protein
MKTRAVVLTVVTVALAAIGIQHCPAGVAKSRG